MRLACVAVVYRRALPPPPCGVVEEQPAKCRITTVVQVSKVGCQGQARTFQWLSEDL